MSPEPSLAGILLLFKIGRKGKLINARFNGLIAAAMLGIWAAAAPASAAPLGIADGGFEAQGALSISGNTASYCYFGGTCAGPCAAAAWTGNISTSSFQGAANMPWPGVTTPDGSYYAVIQSGFGVPGSIAQTITVTNTGHYSVLWLAAGRAGGSGNQGYTLTLASTASPGLTLYSGGVTSSQAFATLRAGASSLRRGHKACHSISLIRAATTPRLSTPFLLPQISSRRHGV